MVLDNFLIHLKDVFNIVYQILKVDGLIHIGIPAATTSIGTVLGGPAGGFVGNVAGREIADKKQEKVCVL
jgi:hypothetical protein